MILLLGDRLSVEISTGRTHMNRFLIALGVVFIAAGLLWPWLRRMHLIHLPGDIIIDRPGLKFMFPLTTMIIVSVVLSLIAWLMRR
jgi:Protein of unknown function (DUF2905)